MSQIDQLYVSINKLTFFIIMEDSHSGIDLKLSKTSSYLLETAEIKVNLIQQQILMLFNSKYSCNQIKKMIKSVMYIIQTLQAVFTDIGLGRIYNNIKRSTYAFNNISNQLVIQLQKQKSGKPIQLSISEQNKPVSYQAITAQSNKYKLDQDRTHLKPKINRFGGISLYNQNYKRRLDSIANLQNNKKKPQQVKQQQNDQKLFKQKLFNKMKSQLKQLQEDLYSPFPDEVSTFLIFQRKFLQSFNHLSHAQNIQSILSYLQNSHSSAIQLVNKSEDLTQQISKFKLQTQMLIREAKIKNKERNQNLSQKFDSILEKFIKKRIQIFKKTSQKVDFYNKMIKEKQLNRVSVGVQTSIRQLNSIKNIQRKFIQLEMKYKTKDQQKDKAYMKLVQRSSSEKNMLLIQLSKIKIIQKNMQQDAQQSSKRYIKAIQLLNQKQSLIKKYQHILQKQKIANKNTQGVNPLDTQTLENKKQQQVVIYGQRERKQAKISVRLSNLGKNSPLNQLLLTQQKNYQKTQNFKSPKKHTNFKLDQQIKKQYLPVENQILKDSQKQKDRKDRKFVSITEIQQQSKGQIKSQKNRVDKQVSQMLFIEQIYHPITISKIKIAEPQHKQKSLKYISKYRLHTQNLNSSSLLDQNEGRPAQKQFHHQDHEHKQHKQERGQNTLEFVKKNQSKISNKLGYTIETKQKNVDKGRETLKDNQIGEKKINKDLTINKHNKSKRIANNRQYQEVLPQINIYQQLREKTSKQIKPSCSQIQVKQIQGYIKNTNKINPSSVIKKNQEKEIDLLRMKKMHQYQDTLPTLNKKQIQDMKLKFINQIFDKNYDLQKKINNKSQQKQNCVQNYHLQELQFTHVYSITLENGNLLKFIEQKQVYDVIKGKKLKKGRRFKSQQNNQWRYLMKQIKKREQKNQKFNQYGMQNINKMRLCSKQNPLTFSKQIIKQLHFYEQFCKKKQILDFLKQKEDQTASYQVVNNKINRYLTNKRELKSLHVQNKKKSLSIQQAQKSGNNIHLSDNQTDNEYFFQVKGLMRNTQKGQYKQNVDIQQKRKLMKKILIDGIKSRANKQVLDLNLKRNDNIYLQDQSKYLKSIKNQLMNTKTKNGKILKKNHRRKQHFAKSYHIKKEYQSSFNQLPQIHIRNML